MDISLCTNEGMYTLMRRHLIPQTVHGQQEHNKQTISNLRNFVEGGDVFMYFIYLFFRRRKSSRKALQSIFSPLLVVALEAYS